MVGLRVVVASLVLGISAVGVLAARVVLPGPDTERGGGAGSGGGAAVAILAAVPDAAAVARPNIVLVSTDDQVAGDLRWMPRTRALLGAQGMTFTRALSPHPLCCPARASLLTGQYAQNHGVRHNAGRWGGYHRLDPTSTIATWLQAAGYRTGFVGKYLNGYDDPSHREPGWMLWRPLVRRIYDYEDFTMAGPGRNRYSGAYVTDVIARRSESWVRRSARLDQPFFLWVSHVAPHGSLRRETHGWGPPVAAPRHRGLFAGTRPASFGRPSLERPGAFGQPQGARGTPLPTRDRVRAEFRARLQALQAVNESVASLVATLREEGQLDRTWIFFASDNGFALGEHQWLGKDLLYREILRVPLLVRGPAVIPGSRSAVPVTLVDLPATIADVARVAPAHELDGRSFLPMLLGRTQRWRDTQLIQTGEVTRAWGWRGVTTGRYTYAEYAATGRQVLFDHARDHWEVDDVADDPSYALVRDELQWRLQQLSDCAGAACDRSLGPVPDPSTAPRHVPHP